MLSLLLAVPLACACAGAAANQTDRPYVDPAAMTSLPFGAHSYWAQPWRAYLRTVPASVFINGTGINFNVDAQQAPNVAEMLARYGIHHARVELGWGSFDYTDENQLDDASIAPRLAALRRNGLRPLILLNANSGAPCPIVNLTRSAAARATRGERTLTFDSVAGIVPGYTGLSNIGPGTAAARILITALQGNVATLSRPLPIDIPARFNVVLTTVKYRPFGVPGSPDYARTMKGWKTYVVNVARIVRADLGTTGQSDGGFDLEIWNELTFGSEFLDIDKYYSPPLVSKPYPNWEIWQPIVAATASAAQTRPDLFSGVLLGDGFANTVPWPASSTEPDGVSAIDKHPYRKRKHFPHDGQAEINLNAALQPDSFAPTYSALFPELDATALFTETLIRDMGPFDNSIYGTIHGENARIIKSRVAPVSVWITETNVSPAEDDPSISAADAMLIKAKSAARYFSLFLNKGVTQVDLYAARDSDRGMGIVQDNFLAYAEQPGALYPVDDKPYLSPALLVTGHIVEKMTARLDPTLARCRDLSITGVTAKSNGVIFRGDGTPVHPDLHAADVFAFLPFQVNEHRFVIPYYIMTHDIMKSWPEDLFTLTVSGFSPTARFSAYDPINDTMADVAATGGAQGITLHVSATDYPRLLIVND